MALPMNPNVLVDVYRTANVANPYALGLAIHTNALGYLEPAVSEGRHGTALYLKWTHVLYLPPEIDIRDAYNSQYDPARNHAIADTVIVRDTNFVARKTAYYVVFVELVSRQPRANKHLKVYLDRFQPLTWPTNSI